VTEAQVAAGAVASGEQPDDDQCRCQRESDGSEDLQPAWIGHATLYKYFPDVTTILASWHERQIVGHLDHLSDVRDRAADAGSRLHAVLEAYALIAHADRRRQGR
jgi:hypothetical protein